MLNIFYKGKIILTLLLLLLFLLSLSNCNTTDSGDDDKNSQDTTSHSINWSIYEIGEEGSYLRDVAIVNDTSIWAVGVIYMNDSLGNRNPMPYNAIHWDGNRWELKRVMFYTFCDQTAKDSYPANSIFVFNNDEIWISSINSQIAILKSNIQISNMCLPVSINKTWGNSPYSVYAVGSNGNITWYNGSVWQQFESGTEVSLRDIWGSPDGSIIWAAGFDDSYGTVLLRNRGNGFEKVLEITEPNIPHPSDQITHVFKSLWTDKSNTVYLGAIGRVYAAPKNTSGYAKENVWWDYETKDELPPETNIIRGTAGNDIFVGGYLQFIQHFNGKSWQRYPEIEGDGTWRGMAVSKSKVVVVGEEFSFPGRARIAIGTRGAN